MATRTTSKVPPMVIPTIAAMENPPLWDVVSGEVVPGAVVEVDAEMVPVLVTFESKALASEGSEDPPVT
jgi:hypothetical protein